MRIGAKLAAVTVVGALALLVACSNTNGTPVSSPSVLDRTSAGGGEPTGVPATTQSTAPPAVIEMAHAIRAKVCPSYAAFTDGTGAVRADDPTNNAFNWTYWFVYYDPKDGDYFVNKDSALTIRIASFKRAENPLPMWHTLLGGGVNLEPNFRGHEEVDAVSRLGLLDSDGRWDIVMLRRQVGDTVYMAEIDLNLWSPKRVNSSLETAIQGVLAHMLTY